MILSVVSESFERANKLRSHEEREGETVSHIQAMGSGMHANRF